jgi:hypothetical protein
MTLTHVTALQAGLTTILIGIAVFGDHYPCRIGVSPDLLSVSSAQGEHDPMKKLLS